MTPPLQIDFRDTDLNDIATLDGKIAVFLDAKGPMDKTTRKVNTLTRGAIAKLAESEVFAALENGKGHVISFAAGLRANAVLVVKLARNPSPKSARRAGVALAKFKGREALHVLAGSNRKAADISLGLALRAYSFDDHKTPKEAEKPIQGTAFMVTDSDQVETAAKPMLAASAGVLFTRDLVNEPSNILTTTEFATRLVAMGDLGLEVEVLDEDALEKLGMGALLGVGQGSASPSKVVVMKWNGGGDAAPFALVGKGVVFDTGGISLKPGAGMEDMTMDMGGAGVVAGVMRTLALRRAAANVVGVVGLVENMPDGNAIRPGDVLTSMKGDTIEVINTDAEGRLVLADIMWYTQVTFNPTGMINLATLTGAIIVGLGHENAGVFSNDDNLCNAFLKAARAEREGAWRMPLGSAYDTMLKSRIADMRNSCGRAAGSITAAQFLKRFVKKQTPWIHLDIAGVALTKTETEYAPKGATGWGVRALDRLIRDKFET